MHYPIFSDEYFMFEALKEAKIAFEEDEVPVGAVIVTNKQIIARAHNSTQKLQDVTAHAEMIALTSASNYLGGKYLPDCTMYVTLEPCLMCASALSWSQISTIVYGSYDPKAGFMKYGKKVLHPKTEVLSGILEQECSDLLKQFFLEKRNSKH